MIMTKRRIITAIVSVPMVALLVACVYAEIVVVNGTGSGTYSLDTSATIQANPPAPGYKFYRWTGDTAKVSDIRSATATIFVDAASTWTVQATYKPSASLYHVSVQGGEGGGEYVLGEQVQIFAAPPGPGQYFMGWQGDVGVLSNPSQSLQTFPMPAYALQFTAVYGN
jgi:hypothetical protein